MRRSGGGPRRWGWTAMASAPPCVAEESALMIATHRTGSSRDARGGMTAGASLQAHAENVEPLSVSSVVEGRSQPHLQVAAEAQQQHRSDLRSAAPSRGRTVGASVWTLSHRMSRTRVIVLFQGSEAGRERQGIPRGRCRDRTSRPRKRGSAGSERGTRTSVAPQTTV